MLIIKSFLLVLSLLCFFSFSKTIIGEAKYQYGDRESLLEAKDICKTLAERNALEQIAVLVESQTSVNNFQLKKDQIISYSKAIIKDEKILVEDVQGRTIYIKLQGEIPEQEVLDHFNKLMKKNEAIAVHTLSDVKPEYENSVIRILSYGFSISKEDNVPKFIVLKVKFKKDLPETQSVSLFFDCFDENDQIIQTIQMYLERAYIDNYKNLIQQVPANTFKISNFKLGYYNNGTYHYSE
jgi:hypothetical protein